MPAWPTSCGSLVIWHSCGDSVDQPHDCMFSIDIFGISIFLNLYKNLKNDSLLFVHMYNSIICNFICVYNKLSFTALPANLLDAAEDLQWTAKGHYPWPWFSGWYMRCLLHSSPRQGVPRCLRFMRSKFFFPSSSEHTDTHSCKVAGNAGGLAVHHWAPVRPVGTG